MNIEINTNEIIEIVRNEISFLNKEITDEETTEIIEKIVLEYTRDLSVSYIEKKNTVDSVFNVLRKELDILQPYADNPRITEIMVNGPSEIFVEEDGSIRQIEEQFSSEEHLEEVVRRLVGKVHKEINDLNPIVDARLDDGSRINAVYKNIALNGSILTIRKFPVKNIDMDFMIESKTITKEAAKFLEAIVKAKYNLFISGGTSSGKTTFLNILTKYIPNDERIIVIEDSAEIQIKSLSNVVRLESKNANVQGKGEIDIRQLIKTSLRMRPDRIIVGEVRGKEALDMLQAMNTGHDGSISTGHSNSAKGMLSRLETMILSNEQFPLEGIQKQIATAIDIIIHLGKIKNNVRKVIEISEVVGYENGEVVLNPLFILPKAIEGNDRVLEATGNKIANIDKLEQSGVDF